jgi:hypothetical protein
LTKEIAVWLLPSQLLGADEHHIDIEGPPYNGFSYNGMVVDRFGNFYGATVHRGEADDGCVYKFTP